METPTELARMIRFTLDELSRENGHHAFEELCRELAQARLVSNVITATGPVVGGGDHGRDFETFPTWQAACVSPGGSSGWLRQIPWPSPALFSARTWRPGCRGRR
jgi:hypothetical protein